MSTPKELAAQKLADAVREFVHEALVRGGFTLVEIRSLESSVAAYEQAASQPSEAKPVVDEDNWNIAVEDAFNNWNRDIDDYTPSLWDAYEFGVRFGRKHAPQPSQEVEKP